MESRFEQRLHRWRLAVEAATAVCMGSAFARASAELVVAHLRA